MQRIVFLCTTEHLDGTVEFLLTSDERIVLLHQVGDASHELVPVARLSASSFLVIIVVIVILVIIVINAHVSLSRQSFERIVTIHAGDELTLSVAHVLAEQIGSL